MTHPPMVFVNTIKKEMAFTFVIFLLKIVFTSLCVCVGGVGRQLWRVCSLLSYVGSGHLAEVRIGASALTCRAISPAHSLLI